MKRLRWLLVLLLLPLLVRAQTCNSLPCGNIPWAIPNLPVLQSPTPMPTLILGSGTAAPTASAAPSETPAPTGTVFSDFSAVGDSLSTLNAVVSGTDIPVEVSGTPVNTTNQLATLAVDTGSFFSYMRGFSEISLGGWGTFIIFGLTSFALVLAIKSLGFLLPMLTAIFGIVFRIAGFVISLFKV
jgi:hypothetical protein